MALIKQGGSKNWTMVFQFNGKQIWKSTKTSNKVLAKRIEQQERDRLAEALRFGTDLEETTFGEALTSYVESMKGRASYPQLKSKLNTLKGIKFDNETKKNIKVYGFDFDMPLHTLQSHDLEMFVSKRQAEGVSQGTIKQQMTVIRAFVTRARKLGFMTPENLDYPVVAVKRQHPMCLSADEEKALLNELDPSSRCKGGKGFSISRYGDTYQDQYDFVVLLLDVGVRFNELAQLRWEDIDLEEKTIFYRSFKADKRQTAFMTDRVSAILQRRAQSKRKKQLYVFENSDKTDHKPYDVNFLHNACKRARIKKNFTFHKARSTFASRLVQNGVSLFEVSQLLNHSSPSTTMIYASLVPNDASRKAVSVLNNLSKSNPK